MLMELSSLRRSLPRSWERQVCPETVRIVVYSDDFSSGDATFVFWALKYLGQENLKVLDGGLEDWKAASCR